MRTPAQGPDGPIVAEVYEAAEDGPFPHHCSFDAAEMLKRASRQREGAAWPKGGPFAPMDPGTRYSGPTRAQAAAARQQEGTKRYGPAYSATFTGLDLGNGEDLTGVTIMELDEEGHATIRTTAAGSAQPPEPWE